MTLHTPQGIMPAPLPMVAAGSQASGLSAPTLLDGAPLAFSSTAKASLPAIAGRQAKKFCLKLDTVLKNPDIYVYLKKYMIKTIVLYFGINLIIMQV